MFPPQKILIAVRVFALINLAILVVLFVSAGLLVRDSSGLDVHGIGAIGLHIASGLLAVSLVCNTWFNKTGVVPAVLSVILFGLTFLQATLGTLMTVPFHVAGALVLTVMATWLTAWTFSSKLPTNKSGTHDHPTVRAEGISS